MDLTAYLAMDGYAWFVWPAWMCATVALIGLYVWSERQLKARQRALDAARKETRQ